MKRSDDAGVQVSRAQRSHPGRATRSEVARPWFTALLG
ncbi:protein of unassigned function [Methylobacterium oryzae CBMB20]|uniref:Protein of unassigned function n=1 Tax=Methylobacterium oryzae CBMB20 TaxID=693986 RepID=A0A089QDD7_9HYPH|nr:protein of unassigned function [Methylobacterium oryzae CBMB20]